MKPIQILLVGCCAALFVACPKVELNQQRANNIRTIGGPALFGTTTFLRGAPVTASSVGRQFELMAASSPQFTTFMKQHAPSLNISKLIPQARAQAVGTGTDCGASSTAYADADGDGILVKVGTTNTAFSYTFDCANGNYDGLQGVKLSGTITVKDNDDTNPNSGYTLGLSNLTLAYTGTITDTDGNEVSGALSLSFNLNTSVTPKAAGAYDVTQSYSFGLKASVGTESFDATFSDNGSLSYTPPARGVLFQQGVINSSDSFSYSITVTKGQQTATEGASFKVQLQNIYVDNGGCADGITVNPDQSAGRAIFSDDSNNKLTWDVIGCGTGNWTYNGTFLGT